MPESDSFFEHYFRRIDPQVAASFTEEQRRAIRTMFGSRGIARHAVDFRRSFRLGRRRFYLVVLAGRERRSIERLAREGMISRGLDWAMSAIAVLVVLLPLAFALYVIKTAAGVNVLPEGGVHDAMQAIGEQLRLLTGGEAR